MFSTFKKFDDGIDELFMAVRNKPAFDRLFYFASETADYSRLWHIIGAAMVLADRSKRADTMRLAISLGVESALVNGLLKNAVPRDRPPLLEDRAHEVRRPKTKSFPSGHASSATMAAVLLSEALPKLKPVWATAAVIVSASRIHNRMHHASDVVAGAAIGYGLGKVSQRLWPLS